MGWGLIIDGMHLPRVTRGQIDYEAADARDHLRWLRERIMCFVCTTPRDQPLEPGEPCLERWEEWAVREVGGIFDELVETARKVALLDHARENPEDVEEY